MSWGVAPQQLPLAPRPQPDETSPRGDACCGRQRRLAGRAAQRPSDPLPCRPPRLQTSRLATSCAHAGRPCSLLPCSRRDPAGTRSTRAPSRPAASSASLPPEQSLVQPPYSTYDRRHEWRVRYGHCGLCLSAQVVPHIRWDWCLAALDRCRVHRIPLQDGCHHCGELDPLPFAAGREPGPPRCWCCGVVLGSCHTPGGRRRT